jgi:hypothetical protein
MGKRGPKPVDFVKLALDADSLATSLYELRDGRPGLLVHLKGGVPKTTFLPEIRKDEIGHPEKVDQRISAGRMRYRPIRTRVSMLVFPETREARKDVLEIVRRSKHWRFVSPLSGRPGIWKRLRTARSAADVRDLARRLTHPLLRSILHSHAEDFLRAKRLPHFPKSNRPRSDTKRIEFFAKVLAGLNLGIAPATATKLLAHYLLTTGDVTRHAGLPDYTEVLKGTRKGRETKRISQESVRGSAALAGDGFASPVQSGGSDART